MNGSATTERVAQGAARGAAVNRTHLVGTPLRECYSPEETQAEAAKDCGLEWKL